MKPDAPAPLLRLSQRTGRSIANLMDDFNERAAIMQWCGGMSKDAAELAAVSDVLAMYETEER